MNIKKIIKEEIEKELLYDFEDATSKEELVAMLNNNNIQFKFLDLNGNEVLIFDNYIIDDFDYSEPKLKEDWLDDLDYNISDYAGFVDEMINDKFWERPLTLYHATPDENVESIKEIGLSQKNQTRGLTNTSVGAAIFTVDNYDILWDGYYGDNIFEIDTYQMKQDGYTPFITKEPDFEEKIQHEMLANKIGLENYQYYVDSSMGMWEDTWIIHDDVPPKYLTLTD